MKLLTLGDLNKEDNLQLYFDGSFDPSTPLEHELEPFLGALEEFADGWMPTLVKGKKRRAYNREAVWKSLEERRDEKSTHMGFYRPAPPGVEVTLSLWFPPLLPELSVTISLQPLSFLADAERCRKFVEMVRAWALKYPATSASAHSMADGQLADAPYYGRDVQTSRRDGYDKIYHLRWLNILGPKLVETVGRERMLSTPAHRVEELPNGSVLLVSWPTAADFASDEARQAQARVHAHLRPDLDYDTLLSTLRQRSATLAPVEPRFHPDVAPLLRRTLDEFAISQRQSKIAEYNAWQPPEPQEWEPAEAALPSDVEDPDGVRRYYGGLAERLVALLHTQVPSVLKETPESLTDADFHFWCEKFPEFYERTKVEELAVPAVGAYLGEVLVRNLGGHWVPRKKLVEGQVVVGQRVWYPFVRAWRYMRSRQSLLDCSLTQLYRVAERYRAPG